ncbi:MAG: flagellar biosynthetic protein FliR [Mangrovicoccus sp.]|nr:flagellar biosynthetic protein FliR [Mangrovicoccus sp.]
MIATLSALAELFGPWLWAGALIGLRISAAVFLLPAFGAQMVPMRVRLGMAFALTLLVTPLVPLPSGWGVPNFALLISAAMSESLTGLCFGFALRLTIWILQIVGSIAAQSISLSQILGGAGVDPQPAISQLFVVAALALAMMAGFHIQIVSAFVKSYDLVPLGQFPLAAAMSDWAVGEVAAGFALAFSLAAPFAIASLLYNMALGAINRAMPQLMVAFVGAPAITAGGLALLAIAAPLILMLWLERLAQALGQPFGPLP